MAEDKDQEGLQTDTGNTGDDKDKTDTADSQGDGTPSKTKDDETDWEQRHKDLQADHTRKSQALAEAEARIAQYERAGSQEESEEDLDVGDDGFVDGKTVNKIVNAAVAKAVGQVRTQSANAYFRRTYKDLVEHENVIAGLLRNPKNPDKLKGASPEERIDAAVVEFKALTEEAVTKAKADAEAEAKAAEEKKRLASGLGSTTTSTPAKGDEDISDEQEIANRKSKSAKQRGLA